MRIKYIEIDTGGLTVLKGFIKKSMIKIDFSPNIFKSLKIVSSLSKAGDRTDFYTPKDAVEVYQQDKNNNMNFNIVARTLKVKAKDYSIVPGKADRNNLVTLFSKPENKDKFFWLAVEYNDSVTSTREIPDTDNAQQARENEFNNLLRKYEAFKLASEKDIKTLKTTIVSKDKEIVSKNSEIGSKNNEIVSKDKEIVRLKIYNEDLRLNPMCTQQHTSPASLTDMLEKARKAMTHKVYVVKIVGTSFKSIITKCFEDIGRSNNCLKVYVTHCGTLAWERAYG